MNAFRSDPHLDIRSAALEPVGAIVPDVWEEPLPFRGFTRRRMLAGLLAIVLVFLLVAVPPLFNAGRYKRQIAASIGASLGRPVHIDNVTVNLLPWPGFTLENFVVGEDPAFGSEPILRAEQVSARVRVRSLWRRRLEFSRIVLSEPSINLVHLPDGRWNLETILLRASHIPVAPTQQRSSGSIPRFPYIEASGARINLKLDMEKTPFSLTESDLALWLPEPGQWHLRIKAHPTRTDTAVSDTGVLRVDGTFGQAATLAAVPLALKADWTGAPLGALSLIVLGRDAGMRGTMHLHTTLAGTIGSSTVGTHLDLDQVRRAEFVPKQPLSASIECTTRFIHLFHVVERSHCVWPGEADGSGLTSDMTVSDVSRPSSAFGSITLRSIPLAGLLDALRIATDRVSPNLQAGGILSGSLPCCSYASLTNAIPTEPSSPPLTLTDANLSLSDQQPILHSTLTATWRQMHETALVVSPVPLQLGGRDPAILSVSFSPSSANFQLTGDVLPSRLRQVARALPQFGNGLEQVLPVSPDTSQSTGPEVPIHVNLLGKRAWFGQTRWSAVMPTPTSPRRRSGPLKQRRR